MSSTLKAEIYQPSELYDAIVAYYQAQIAAGDSADVVVTGYQDFVPANAADRQVLVEMGVAEGGEKQNDGRIAQVFECILYAVISKAQPDAALQAMNLASALARHLEYQGFGFSGKAVDEPHKVEMVESFLIGADDQHAGFEAWEVRWRQQLNLGAPQYEDEPEVTGIFLAVNPVNPDDESEYSEVTGCLTDSLIQ